MSDTLAWRDGPLEPGPAVIVDLDGDPRNAAMFEAEGIPCLYVHSGYYGAP